MMNTEKTPITEQEAKEAATELRTAFIGVDPAWHACGKEDCMGIYRFLTGTNSYTMRHLFEKLKKAIATIIAYGEYEIEQARLALAA